MKHEYIKETGLGDLTSKFVEHKDGSVSVYTMLHGNGIYRGEFNSRASAEAWFIINGYDLIY